VLSGPLGGVQGEGRGGAGGEHGLGEAHDKFVESSAAVHAAGG